METPTFRETEWLFQIVDSLAGSAVELGRSNVKRMLRKPRPSGACLHPGLDTPLWNALAAAVRPYLKKRGEKAQLARLLYVHRPRVHAYFVHGSAMPDAERTLLLLQWLASRRRGGRPG